MSRRPCIACAAVGFSISVGICLLCGGYVIPTLIGSAIGSGLVLAFDAASRRWFP